jgi:hypothetical protein
LRERGLIEDLTEAPRRRDVTVTAQGEVEAERIVAELAKRLLAENDRDDSDFAPDAED